MSESKITQAVEQAILRVRRAQQIIHGLTTINTWYANTHPYQTDKQFDAAFDIVWSKLHIELAHAWNDLALFYPISKTAAGLLRERTKSYFGDDVSHIMRLLGQSGSYSVADKETFQQEVLALFQDN